MAVIVRRSVLAGAAGAAAVTVAAALLLRKPAAPPVPSLRPDSAPEQVRLQDIAALHPTTPPRALPAIGFVDATGAAHQLAAYAGRPVLLNLWATWCPPCVAELPALAALARTAATALAVLPLSSDRGGAARVAGFFRSHAITGLPVLLDPNGAAVEALAARGLPTTLLIDGEGRERARLEGAADWAAPDVLAALLRLTA